MSTIPVEYVPAWFPGANFQRIAKVNRELAFDMRYLGYHAAKDAYVSYHKLWSESSYTKCSTYAGERSPRWKSCFEGHGRGRPFGYLERHRRYFSCWYVIAIPFPILQTNHIACSSWNRHGAPNIACTNRTCSPSPSHRSQEQWLISSIVCYCIPRCKISCMKN